MKVFLSHAAADSALAEQACFALRELDYEVFFDRSSLPHGEGFHQRIREELVSSDLFVILVSRNALRAGSYCLTEIEFAQQRWPHPTGRVLPVLIEPLKASDLPAFLTAVTYLEPKGNVVAETAAATAQLARRIRRRHVLRIALAAAAVAVVSTIALVAVRANAETGPVRALPGALRHRVRVATTASDGRMLLALADPPELVEFTGAEEMRVLAKLDAEPIALASGDEMLAVATGSSTPIQLFRGAGFEPLAPLAIEFACDDCDQHPDGLATRPVELAVFDERVWVRTREENRAPGFIAYTPQTEQWKLPYYGHYSYEQLVEFGAWTEGARLRVVNDHLWALSEADGHAVIALADQELAVFSDAADGEFACARDIAQGPERSLVLLGCDGALVRLTQNDQGDFQRETLGQLELPPRAATTQLDHRIACAPGRVLLAVTARDTSAARPILWTDIATWDPLAGLRTLRAVPGQACASIATTPELGLIVLRGDENAWDALEVVY